MKKIFLACFIILLNSCICFAPFSSPNTARSNGKGNWNLEAGVNANGGTYHIKAGLGFLEKLDIGLQQELGVANMSGLWAKYAFISKQEGLSLALEGSHGITMFFGSGKYYTIAPILSYKFWHLEPYLVLRYNYVKMDEEEVDLGDTIGKINVDVWSYSYFYSTLGLNFWIKEWIGLNINANYIFISRAHIDGSAFLFGGSLAFRF